MINVAKILHFADIHFDTPFTARFSKDEAAGARLQLRDVFSKIIEEADLIITGEGKIDRQSLMGKVVSGVLAQAQIRDIPVLAICGKVEDAEILMSYSSLMAIFPIYDETLSLKQNMQTDIALRNLKHTIHSELPKYLKTTIL